MTFGAARWSERWRASSFSAYASQLALRRAEHAAEKARDETEEALSARSAFLSGLNHELRTPLNAITGFAGLLKEADTLGVTAAKKTEYLDHVLSSARLLLERIDMILDAAGRGEKAATEAVQGTDAVPVLRRLLQEHAGNLFLTGVDIEKDLPLTVIAERDLYANLQSAFAFVSEQQKKRQAVTVRLFEDTSGGGEKALILKLTLLSTETPIEESAVRALRRQLLASSIRFEIEGDGEAGVSLSFAFPMAGGGHPS